jgi:hypothetical protein
MNTEHGKAPCSVFRVPCSFSSTVLVPTLHPGSSTHARDRGRQGVCRSLTELTQKSRRLGDGYYYLAASVWPAEETSIVLQKTWETMS